MDTTIEALITFSDGSTARVPYPVWPMPPYSVYFGAELPPEPDHSANLKAALASLHRDLSSCPRCSHGPHY